MYRSQEPEIRRHEAQKVKKKDGKVPAFRLFKIQASKS